MDSKGLSLFWDEYNHKEEVLPVLLMGVVGNIIGYFINVTYIENSILFLDTSGTIFSSMILGPWYGAIVGVITNFINGTFTGSWFAFGLTNIMIGLFVGYVCKNFFYFQEKISNYRLKDYLFIWLKLFVLVTIISTITSVAIKNILYVDSGLPLLLDKPYYNFWKGLNENVMLSDLFVLVVADAVREGYDKAITSAFALVMCVSSQAYIYRNQEEKKQLVRVTGSLSPALFVVFYSIYLSLASYFVPSIKLNGFSQSIEWLKNYDLLFMQYLPIAFSAIAIIYSNCSQNSSEKDKMIKNLIKRNRISLGRMGDYLRKSILDKKNTLNLFNRKELYGMVIAVVSWPLGKEVASYNTEPFNLFFPFIYFVGMSLVLFLYFSKSREYKNKYKQCLILYDELYSSISEKEGYNFYNKRVNYLKQMLTDRGFINELELNVPDENLSSILLRWEENGCVKKVIILMETGGVKYPGCDPKIINDLFESFDDVKIYYLTNKCEERSHYFYNLRSLVNRKELVVINIIELIRSIPFTAQNNELKFLSFVDGIALYRNYLAKNENSWFSKTNDDGCYYDNELCDIIDSLPANSKIIDAGCGFGRYTLLAAEKDHRVIAIEKNPETYKKLINNISNLNIESKIETLNIDYLKYKIKDEVDLVISAGVLQNSSNKNELMLGLEKLKKMGCHIYIEMLFNMYFDGKVKDNRVEISHDGFLNLLKEIFLEEQWFMQILGGIDKRTNLYPNGQRSFKHEFYKIDYDSIRILLSKENKRLVL